MGDLYIADTGNFAIRRVEFAAGNLSTVVGSGQGGYTGDNGPTARATLWEPSGVAMVDVPDNVVPAHVEVPVHRRHGQQRRAARPAQRPHGHHGRPHPRT
jgi:hypothetical protein